MYKSVLIFDGDCPLCNKLVKLVYRIDRDKKVMFASSSSNYVKENFSMLNLDFDSTVVYFSNATCYTKSEAIFYLIQDLYPTNAILWFMQFVSFWSLDKVYDFISTNRYRIRRKHPKTCIYDRELQKRLLD